jgi:hypothetical protein
MFVHVEKNLRCQRNAVGLWDGGKAGA